MKSINDSKTDNEATAAGSVEEAPSPGKGKTTVSSTTNSKPELPKAMIKPNVLNHVIEGFVIQEADEPFPVTRQRYTDKESSEEPPSKFNFSKTSNKRLTANLCFNRKKASNGRFDHLLANSRSNTQHPSRLYRMRFLWESYTRFESEEETFLLGLLLQVRQEC